MAKVIMKLSIAMVAFVTVGMVSSSSSIPDDPPIPYPPPHPPRAYPPPHPPPYPHHNYKQKGIPYSYSYTIKDEYVGADYGKEEKSDGDVVQGSYYVALPDGRLQTVKYSADHVVGYVADVEYQGDAKHPPPYAPVVAYRPQYPHPPPPPPPPPPPAPKKAAPPPPPPPSTTTTTTTTTTTEAPTTDPVTTYPDDVEA